MSRQKYLVVCHTQSWKWVLLFNCLIPRALTTAKLAKLEDWPLIQQSTQKGLEKRIFKERVMKSRKKENYLSTINEMKNEPRGKHPPPPDVFHLQSFLQIQILQMENHFVG